VENSILHDHCKNQEQIGGCHLEGYITDPMNMRNEERTRRQRRMEVSCEGGNGPEEAVTPWMDG